jgi:hypothetical protein
MNNIYYFAAYTDRGCLVGCDHEHPTVVSATACISFAGGYPIAVDSGVLRALNDAEEAEFQEAMYGSEEVVKRDSPKYSLLVRVHWKPLG